MTLSIGRILLPAFASLGLSLLASGASAAPQAPAVAQDNSAAMSVGYRNRGHGGYGYRGGRGYSRQSRGRSYRYRGGGYGYGGGYGGAYVVNRLFRGLGYYGRSHGGYRSTYGYRSNRYRRNRSYGGGYGYGGYNYR